MQLLTLVPEIERIVTAISDALNIDSAVIDNNGQIIICTERYRQRKGLAVHFPFIQEVMTRGNVMVKNPGFMAPCAGCRFSQQCPATFEILSPITSKQHPVGVISLTAFTREGQRRMSRSLNKYAKLTEVMAALIADTIDHPTDNNEFLQPAVKTQVAVEDNRLIGSTTCMNSLRAKLPLISRTDSTVLITGETGTGKGHLARIIHDLGPRAKRRFISINCASIPHDLLESELFGYEEGAFTGAKRGGKLGKFELANGGTLFLDEIGDMPLSLQPKLLKVLEDKCIERVGGTEAINIDVRIIAATNCDLDTQMEQAKFRADLYYRLNVLPIRIPPLRDRSSDIDTMAGVFLERHCNSLGRKAPILSREALDLLQSYDWPGNVRQLDNAMEYVACMESRNVVGITSFPDWLTKTKHQSVQEKIQNVESETIRSLLDKFGFDVKGKTLAANELGIGLRTLYRKIKEYDI